MSTPPQGTREGHHVDPPRARTPKLRRGGADGRSGRVDVVDEEDARRRTAPRAERRRGRSRASSRGRGRAGDGTAPRVRGRRRAAVASARQAAARVPRPRSPPASSSGPRRPGRMRRRPPRARAPPPRPAPRPRPRGAGGRAPSSPRRAHAPPPRRRPPPGREVKARRLPVHSPQRSTGQAVGVPQRAQSGGRTSASRLRHARRGAPPAAAGDAAERKEQVEEPIRERKPMHPRAVESASQGPRGRAARRRAEPAQALARKGRGSVCRSRAKRLLGASAHGGVAQDALGELRRVAEDAGDREALVRDDAARAGAPPAGSPPPAHLAVGADHRRAVDLGALLDDDVAAEHDGAVDLARRRSGGSRPRPRSRGRSPRPGSRPARVPMTASRIPLRSASRSPTSFQYAIVV